MSKRTITLGKWDGQPIEWLVLKEDEFKTLVISKDILFFRRFDSRRSNSGNMWDTCELRSFLNVDFYNNAFSNAEQKKIINCKISGEEFPTTKDNIFILSVKEATNLFSSNDERRLGNIWSLRSKHCDGLQYTSHVREDGVVKDISSSCTYTDNSYGIRPAMYIITD